MIDSSSSREFLASPYSEPADTNTNNTNTTNDNNNKMGNNNNNTA